MKLKHLTSMVLALTLGLASYAQDTIPQRDTTGKDTTTIPQKDTLTSLLAMNRVFVADTIPQKTDTTQKDTSALVMVNALRDTTTLPKKDSTELPKKDSTASYAKLNTQKAVFDNKAVIMFIKEWNYTDRV